MSRELTGATPRTPADIAGDAPSVFTFGAVGDGVTDDTGAILTGIGALAAVGGGSLYFPGGYTYACGLIDFSQFADTPLTFYGDGAGSLIIRNAAITSGDGWWNIAPQTGQPARIGPVKFSELGFDGDVTTSVGYLYSAIPSDDPMASILTTNSSFWVKGGCSNITWDNVLIQHTGGYAILLDARTANINTIRVKECDFLNNRPNLFGVASAVYGSWTGGIHYQMDGISSTTSVTDLDVSGCLFSRGTGNQVWGHAYSVTTGYHNRIRVNNNWFEDIGLDAIEMGQVLGCSAIGNDNRRIGYICSDDTSPSVPMWESGGPFAVGLDTTGVVKDGVYGPNTFLSINGGVINADGLCYSTITGNTGRIPISGDPEYTTDSIATFGPGGTGANWSQGIITDNSANQEGGSGLTVSGNTFYNLGGTNLGAYACRNGHWIGNRCYLPAAPNQAPAAFGNQSTGANQRAYNNTMVQTYFYWSPASASPCIIEDATGGAFMSTDQNLIVGTKMFGNGNAYEFLRNTVTISAVRDLYGTNSASVTGVDQHYVQEEGYSAGYSTSLKWYFQNTTGATQHMQLQAFWATAELGPLLNVSAAGVGGVIATGARTTSLINDGIITGMVYGDGFFALTDTTYSDANANLLNQVVGGGATGVAVTALMRYHGATGYIEQSTSISSGSRVWAPFSASAGGSDEDVQYNKSGVLFGDSNLQWNYTNNSLVIVGNSSTFGEQIVISGNATGQQSAISFQSTGTQKWQVGKDASDNFFILDQTGGVNVFYMYPGADFALLPVGNVLVGTSTDDSSGAKLQIDGFVSATGGYYSGDTSYQAVKILSGGVNASSVSLEQYAGFASVSSPTITSGDSWPSDVTGVIYYDASSGTPYWYLTNGSSGNVLVDAYLHAAGVDVTSTSYQAIQAPSGGFYGNSINLKQYCAFASVSSPTISSGDSWASDVTGILWYNASSGTQYFYLSYGNSGSPADAYLHAAGVDATSTSYQAVQVPSGGFYGNSINLKQYAAFASVSSPTISSGDSWASSATGVLWYSATSGTAYHHASCGNSGSLADAFFYGAGLYASSTNYNAITSEGGAYTLLGVTTDQCFYPKGYSASSSLDPPASGYGALAYKSGSAYWYYNGSAFASVDLSAVGSSQWITSGSSIYYNSGNVAIGTSSAGKPLVVIGYASGDFPCYFGNVGGYGINLGAEYTGTYAQIQATQTGITNNVNLCLNPAAGNVGIGTSSPGDLLQVGSGFTCDGSNVSMTGNLALTVGGINVNSSSAYNSIQSSNNGGMAARSFTASVYVQLGSSAGAPTATTSDGFHAGALNWNTSTPGLQVYNGSAWVAVGSGSGVSSITGTTNEVIASASTGAITLSLPQAIATTSSVQFGSMESTNISGDIFSSSTGSFAVLYNGYTSALTFYASATSTAIAFQNWNAAYTVNGNGAILCTGITCGNNGCGAAGFNPWNGSGYDSGVGSGGIIAGASYNFEFLGGSLIYVAAVSDARLKTVTAPYSYGLTALRSLNPVFFEWNALAQARHKMPTSVQMGLLAQDVIKVIPEASIVGRDGYYGYDKDAIILTLIASVKELDAELAQLKTSL